MKKSEIAEIKNTALETMADRMARLRQKAANAPEVWQPEPGESLIGELIGHQKAVGAYGENYQMLVRGEASAVTAVWITPWLKENLRAQGAETGDLVAIIFIGKKHSPAGRQYNAYSLTVDKTV